MKIKWKSDHQLDRQAGRRARRASPWRRRCTRRTAARAGLALTLEEATRSSRPESPGNARILPVSGFFLSAGVEAEQDPRLPSRLAEGEHGAYVLGCDWRAPRGLAIPAVPPPWLPG